MPKAGAARRIVVAIDFSAATEATLAWATEIASASGSRIWLFHAVPSIQTGAGVAADRLLQRELVGRAASELARIAKRLRERGLEVETRVEPGEATRWMNWLVTAVGADLAVTGTRGRGRLRRLVLGSTAEGLVRDLQIPLLVVHEHDRAPTSRPLRLLVGSDLSPEAAAARRSATRLLPWQAAVSLVHSTAGEHVEPWFERGDPRQDAVARHLASERLRAEAAELEERGEVPSSLRHEPPAEAIAAAAREQRVDLIVVGSRRTSELSQRALGTTATRLLQIAPCPVLISPVRQGTATKVHDGARRARKYRSRSKASESIPAAAGAP